MIRRRLLAGVLGGALGATLVGCAPKPEQTSRAAGQRLADWLASQPQVASVESVTPEADKVHRPWADATITLASTVDQAGLADLLASFNASVGGDVWTVVVRGKVRFDFDSRDGTTPPGLPSVWHGLNSDAAVGSVRVRPDNRARFGFDASTTADPFAHLLDLLAADWMATWVVGGYLRGPDSWRTCSYERGPISQEQANTLRQLAAAYGGPLSVTLAGTGMGTIQLTPPPGDRAELNTWLKTWQAPGAIRVVVD